MHGMRDRNPQPGRRPPAGQNHRRQQQRRQGNTSPENARRNYERYLTLGREATVRGDPVEAENCFQHAEHYFRLMQGVNRRHEAGAGADGGT